jgi:hypothetical protein
MNIYLNNANNSQKSELSTLWSAIILGNKAKIMNDVESLFFFTSVFCKEHALIM